MAKSKSMVTQTVHQFAEKVALITNGADPVGKAAALQLAMLGAFVIVGVRNQSDAAAFSLDELTSLGTLAGVTEADASTVGGASALVNFVHERFGRLDLLVDCVQLSPSVENNDHVVEYATALMSERPKPKIVQLVNSRAESDAEQTLLTRFWALPAALGDKFRVNCVISRGDYSAQAGELVRPPTPIPPKDVASVVVFLLSSESKALNGQVLYAG